MKVSVITARGWARVSVKGCLPPCSEVAEARASSWKGWGFLAALGPGFTLRKEGMCNLGREKLVEGYNSRLILVTNTADWYLFFPRCPLGYRIPRAATQERWSPSFGPREGTKLPYATSGNHIFFFFETDLGK